MATKIVPVSNDVKVWQSGEDGPNTPLADLLKDAFVEIRKSNGNGTGNRRRRNRRSKQK